MRALAGSSVLNEDEDEVEDEDEDVNVRIDCDLRSQWRPTQDSRA